MSKDWSMLLNFVKGNTMQPIDIMDIIEIMMDEYGFTLDTIQPQEGNSRYFEVGFSDYNSKTMQNIVIVGTGDLVYSWDIDRIIYTHEETYEDGSGSFISDIIYGLVKTITYS